MEVCPTLLFFSTVFLFFSSSCAAVDTVSPNQRIKDGQTIVSDGGMYELGFFSPGKSSNRYLGIWYKQISIFTVVWVANRETPIKDTSGVLEVSKEGTLLIHSGGNTSIWSSNSTISAMNFNPTANPTAQLLDNGNLVVWDESSTKESPIWESFDYPGNTWLPGMKLGKDFTTGRERYVTSWKSHDDPSLGLYKVWVDINGYPQIFKGERESLVELSRVGPWNGIRFRGFPIEDANPVYFEEFVVTQKEVYLRYKVKTSVILRMVLMPDGTQLQLNWIERTKKWVVYANVVVDSCSPYGQCGPYGSCKIKMYPPCICMEGFEPKVPEEWKAGDWSSGCQRKRALGCGTHDGFKKITGVKFPDTRRSWYNVSMSLGECEMACIMKCNCSAFSNLDIRNGGSGCLLWFDELMDMREYYDHQELYIRMAISELQGESSFKKKNILKLLLSVSSTAMFLCGIAYVFRKNKKRAHKKGRDINDGMENLDEIPFFSLEKIAKATNNFNIDNKIGEGGFGSVYKGVLEDGELIAVKRLAETSQQGLDEFRNEVICIAKLQHRSLVKLLGYCIHENEMILIYEYMVNGSLDSFIFDKTRSSMLDWPHRFGIIQEYAVHGRFSTKSDVFSFGVIVLEIVSGRKNRSFSHESHGDNLLGHAWRLYKEDKLIELMSASLHNSCVVSEVLRSIHVGLLCVQHHAEDRPTMLSVILMLISDGALPPPKQPAFFTEESDHKLNSVLSAEAEEYILTVLYAR